MGSDSTSRRILGLRLDNLEHMVYDVPMTYTEAEIEEMLEAAGRKATAKAAEAHAQHEAFHGKPIRIVVVGRRSGYKGEPVCHDCYYGKTWRV